MSFIDASYQLAKGAVQVMGHDTANLMHGAATANIIKNAASPLEAFVAKLGEARGGYADLMAAGARGAKDPEMARHFAGVQNSLREALDIGVPKGVLKVQVNTTLGQARKAAETVATQLEKTPAGSTLEHTDAFADAIRTVRNGLDEGWKAVGIAKGNSWLQ